MSLINDALKKAQHQRTGEPGDLPPMPGGGPRAANTTTKSGMPARTLALIIAGVGGAVVAAVIVTIAIVRRPAAPAHAPKAAPVVAQPAPAPTPVVAAPAPSPVIVAPVIAVPKVEEPPAKPAPTEPVRVAAAQPPAPAPTVATPAPAPTPNPEPPRVVATGKQDIRILTLIDALRVTGIRASGADSKVLMNDRVYRINDTVDYTLGIKLTRVAAEGLTFVDANGTIYVKNF